MQTDSTADQQDNKKTPAVALEYFGTDPYTAGHYFWHVKDNDLTKSGTWFSDLPFNPEELFLPNTEKGTVKYLRRQLNGVDYAICAIAGSCSDTRWGTKSVFWTKEPVKLGDLKGIILSYPIGRRMIEKMPFEVKW